MSTLSTNPKFISVSEITVPIDELSKLSPKLVLEYRKLWESHRLLKILFNYNDKIIESYVVEPIKGKKQPLIVYNRGGIGEFGKLENKHLFFKLFEMASWGYIVGAVEYGKYDQYGGEDVEYVKHFVKLLEDFSNIDCDQVGLYGGSRGGMMNYLLLQTPTFAKCAVIKAGVTNQERGYKMRPELLELDQKFYQANSDVERQKRSAVEWVDKLSKDSPVLLIHGTNDVQVSVLDSLEISQKLFDNRVPFSMHILNGDDHRLSNNKSLVSQLTKKWFDTYLTKE